jgi:hypothetical protein
VEGTHLLIQLSEIQEHAIRKIGKQLEREQKVGAHKFTEKPGDREDTPREGRWFQKEVINCGFL